MIMHDVLQCQHARIMVYPQIASMMMMVMGPFAACVQAMHPGAAEMDRRRTVRPQHVPLTEGEFASVAKELSACGLDPRRCEARGRCPFGDLGHRLHADVLVHMPAALVQRTAHYQSRRTEKANP